MLLLLEEQMMLVLPYIQPMEGAVDLRGSHFRDFEYQNNTWPDRHNNTENT